MREAKYKRPLITYVTESVYKQVKTITDTTRISVCEWLRKAIDDVLGNSTDTKEHNKGKE